MTTKDVTAHSAVTHRAAPRDEAKVRDLGLARVFPVFSVFFAGVYFFGIYTGYGPIRYYPSMNEVHIIWSTAPLAGAVGPVMMWYGWVINGTIAGIIAAALALLIPADVLNRLWARWVWVPVAVAIGLVAWVIFLLQEYFTV
jgi:hypothetical protein